MRFIYNSLGEIKYKINDNGSEIHVYDANMNLKYRYVKGSDQTLDAHGNVYMYGNILLDLD